VLCAFDVADREQIRGADLELVWKSSKKHLLQVDPDNERQEGVLGLRVVVRPMEGD
jgi:hypothetical protein